MPRHTFARNDYALSYYEAGSGPTLVLIHGFPLDHRMWSPQIEALSSSCRVVAPDLRGFGQSTLSGGDEAKGIEMASYAEDVAAVLDHAGIEDPAILCGFSMGGYVLWQFLSLFPERVRALVPCDTKATADSEEAAANRIRMAESVLESGPGPVAEAMLPKLLAESTFKRQPEVVEQVGDLIRACSPTAIAAAQRGMSRRPDVTDQLPQIDRPALVIVGAEDAISTPAEMEQIASALPLAELVTIETTGHMTTLENPAGVNEALLGFVKRLSR